MRMSYVAVLTVWTQREYCFRVQRFHSHKVMRSDDRAESGSSLTSGRVWEHYKHTPTTSYPKEFLRNGQ